MLVRDDIKRLWSENISHQPVHVIGHFVHVAAHVQTGELYNVIERFRRLSVFVP